MKAKPFIIALLAMVMLCAGATSLLAQAPKEAKEEKKAEVVPTTIKLLWQKKLPPFGFIVDDADSEKKYGTSHEWLKKELNEIQDRLVMNPHRFLPPFSPIAQGNRIFLSTYSGLIAVSLIDDKVDDYKPGEVVWLVETDRSLIEMAKNDRGRSVINTWKNEEKTSDWMRTVLYDHTLNGTVAIDGKRLSVLNDIGMLPSSNSSIFRPFPSAKFAFGPFEGMVGHNEVRLLDAESGKLLDLVGDDLWSKSRIAENDRRKLVNRLFLSPPVFHQNRYFVISEKQCELSLYCLDSAGDFVHARDELSEKKGIIWQTKLLTALKSIILEPMRRIHALNIVRADDMLICPTHLGIIFAVNTKKGDILWSYRYADEKAKRFEDFSTTWKVSAPIVLEDRVLYAPPDGEMLLCLGRKDGKVLWQVDRGTGLFPATVHDGKLLVVEEQSLWAVNIKDGTEAWKQPLPGFPVGRGVVVGTRYYLPLGTNGKKPLDPQIGIYEMADGKRVGTLLVTKDTLPLGNLIVHNGQIISQSIEGVAVFELPK